LYGCSHADDGKRIVQLYQEIADTGKEQKADNAVGPCGYVHDIPQRVGRLLDFQSGQENGGQHPTGNTRKDNDGQRKSARRYPSL